MEFMTLCQTNEKGVLRTSAQCAALGAVNCVWCAGLNMCMFGSSPLICSAKYPDRFYDYCIYAA